jgi:DNA-binding protein H-NS
MSVKSSSFEMMSTDELWALHNEIGKLLTERIREEKAKLERRLATLINRTTAERRPYPKVLPKYRNPADPTETWSGRGKLPKWVKAQLKSGKKLEDFAI